MLFSDVGVGVEEGVGVTVGVGVLVRLGVALPEVETEGAATPDSVGAASVPAAAQPERASARAATNGSLVLIMFVPWWTTNLLS